MKKILILCPYPEACAPTQRLKYEQYFSHLRSKGFVLTVSPFMSQRMWQIVYQKGHTLEKIFWVLFGYTKRVLDLFRIPFYDGIYVSLQVTPLGGPLFERLTRTLAKKMVYDIDDLVFLGKTSAVNAIAAWLKSPAKYFYLMEKSDHVITCTPYLDAIVRKYNANTTDISSTIRTDDYIPKNAYYAKKTLVIGWSGSHSTAPYLKLLHNVLLRLQEKIPFELLVIGDENFQLDGLKVRALPWKEASEVADLQQIDIGLYPLPNEEWVLGKSGLKALQYMALGIPTVATAIGANFRVIENEESGFLVEKEDEWLEKLLLLAKDPALREKLGRKARERVEKLYSVNANAPRYEKIFCETFGRP